MRIKYIIRSVAFMLTASLLLVGFSLFCRVNNPRDQIGIYAFYEEPKDSIDVALIGASEVYSGFYSPLAYKKYGFTSYALSSSAMPASVYIPAIREFRTYQNPQLLVIEMWGYTYKDEKQTDEDNIRKYLDNTKKSDNKTKTIEELIPEENRESFYYPFLKYHFSFGNFANCYKVAKNKFQIKKRGYSISKNFSTTSMTFDSKADKSIPDNKSRKVKFSDSGMDYLKQTLDYCKEQKIENVLFVYFPDLNTYDEESFAKAENLIKSYGYDFMNFSKNIEMTGIDKKTDFYNVTHLNINGAVKFTECLGKYISDNYSLNTDHSDEVTAEWDDCASYNDLIISNCKKRLKTNKKFQVFQQDDFLYYKQKG